MSRGRNLEWTDDAISRLGTLWGEGHSTAEIARRMGVSKNSIVGKAHRLNLPGRPSPIRRGAGGAVIKRAPKNTLDIVVERAPRPDRKTPVGRVTPQGKARMPIEGVTLPQLASVQPVATVAPPKLKFVGQIMTCDWPLNDGKPRWTFCGCETVPGKPYCAEHVRRARASNTQVADAA